MIAAKESNAGMYSNCIINFVAIIIMLIIIYEDIYGDQHREVIHDQADKNFLYHTVLFLRMKSNKTGFIDTEVSEADHKAYDFGAVNENDEKLHTGSSNEFHSIQQMREDGLLADAKDLTAYIQKIDTVNKLMLVLHRFQNLETFLLDHIDADMLCMNYKELNEAALAG